MAFNFVKSAIAETSLSPIMVDREKMETEDVVGRELPGTWSWSPCQ